MPSSVILFLCAAGAFASGWGGWEIWKNHRRTRGADARRDAYALAAAVPFLAGVFAWLGGGLDRPELVLASAAVGFAAAGLFALLASQHSTERDDELLELRRQLVVLESRLEQARLETLRAEDSSETAKTQFLSNMSHELRTPLAGVLGAVELLAGAERDDPVDRRYLRIIEKSTRSLLQMVDNVLDFTVNDGEVGTSSFAPFELEATLEQARSVVELAAAEKGLEIAVEVADGLPPWLLGESTSILRILLNLLDNAVKFTDEGSVTLRARFDDLPASPRVADSQPLTVWLRLEVIDTGIGIGDQTEVILFEPLAQKDASMSRSYGGVGMGLAVSRRLARALGGRIEVQSRPGLGSTFALVLPLEVGEATAADERQEEAPPRRQLLVVDDDPVSRMIAESQASSLGYRVDVVESGQAAIEALRRRNYNAVLMDCRMPGLDGYETTRRWRGQEGDQESAERLPVIAVTAHARADERERCLAAGMDEVLEKPVDTAELAATLERVLPPERRAN